MLTINPNVDIFYNHPMTWDFQGFFDQRPDRLYFGRLPEHLELCAKPTELLLIHVFADCFDAPLGQWLGSRTVGTTTLIAVIEYCAERSNQVFDYQRLVGYPHGCRCYHQHRRCGRGRRGCCNAKAVFDASLPPSTTTFELILGLTQDAIDLVTLGGHDALPADQDSVDILNVLVAEVFPNLLRRTHAQPDDLNKVAYCTRYGNKFVDGVSGQMKEGSKLEQPLTDRHLSLVEPTPDRVIGHTAKLGQERPYHLLGVALCENSETLAGVTHKGTSASSHNHSSPGSTSSTSSQV